jgi:GMP synthase-like glutamine amidotransferase
VGPIAEEPWFQFHHDEISPPAAAVELARNASGTQAFRLGRGLGVQFHPEMTARLLASWYPAGAADALVEMGVDPDRLLEESAARAVESQPALERMLDWFLDEVVGDAGADHTISGVG